MCTTEYITNCAINDDVRKMLNSIAEKNGFKKFYLEVTEGIKGEGFTGLAKNVKIYNSHNLNQILSLYVKSAIKEKSAREDLPVADMFTTEMYMYNTIFPYFKDLEISRGITPSTFMPRFFGSILNDENEVVIMENLTDIGYRMHDSSKPLDSQHIRLAIIQFAKYHSLSLALRDKKPEVFEKLESYLPNTSPKIIYDFKNTVINKCNEILNFLNEVESKRLRNFLQNIEYQFKTLLYPPIDEYSVILHADCWLNNILFQYPEKSSKPISACIIDYQLARLAPPILDVAYFLFASSSEQEVSRCNEYLELYYKTLSTHLQKLGCDPNKLYPHSVFQKQWNTYAKYSVIITPLALLLMIRTESETRNLENSPKACSVTATFNRSTKNDNQYIGRFKAVISYLVKNNLI